MAQSPPPTYEQVMAESRALQRRRRTRQQRGDDDDVIAEVTRRFDSALVTFARNGSDDDRNSSFTEIRCSSKEDAMKILMKFSKKKWKLKKKNIEIETIRPSCVLKYTETRWWKEACVTWHEEKADVTSRNRSRHRQVTSSSSRVDLNELKVNETRKIENSKKIISCPQCMSRGLVTCVSCEGVGHVACWRCQHSGLLFTSNQTEICYDCSGSGKESCATCMGSRNVECEKCGGSGKIIRFQIVKAVLKRKPRVTYDFDDRVFPEKLLQRSSGHRVLVDVITSSSQVTSSSQRSVTSSASTSSSSSTPERIFLKQTKNLEIIPVNEVTCRKMADHATTTSARFWIVGRENNVHLPPSAIASLRSPDECRCVIS